MNCDDVRREIELYALGAADETESRLIEEHLSRCPSCRQIERQCSLLLANLGHRQRSSEAGPELASRVLSVADCELRRARRRRRVRRFVVTAAPLAAVLLLGSFMWLNRWSGGNGKAALSSVAQATTLWQKDNAIGMGLANADDVVVDQGTVFFLAGDSSRPVVTAVDADSGQTKWRSELVSCGCLETDGEHLYCVAIEANGDVSLSALDKQSGQLKWTFEAPGISRGIPQPSKPTIVGEDRICWTCENTVYAIDSRTSDEIWRREFEGEGYLSRTGAVAGSIYTAGRNGIYCMDAKSGLVRWHMPCRFYTWPGASPLIAAAGPDTLFVAAGSRDGRSLVQRINVSTRECLWERLVPRAAHMYVDSSHVYIRCQDVLALDQATGRPVWSVKAAGCSPITECDNKICFVDRTEEGRLVAVNRLTGRPAWHVSGLNSCNAFVRIGRQGYLMTNDSELLALAFD